MPVCFDYRTLTWSYNNSITRRREIIPVLVIYEAEASETLQQDVAPHGSFAGMQRCSVAEMKANKQNLKDYAVYVANA